LYTAGKAILAGRSPYQPNVITRTAALQLSGRGGNPIFAVPVYPAPTLLATTPLSLLSYRLAALVFWLVSIGCIMAGLRLLGVQDWRCVGAAFLSFPVVHDLALGAIDSALIVGIGALWHWRDRLWTPASAAAAVVVAKLFAWPVAIWLLIIRRSRTMLLGLALALIGTVACWSLLGFAGMADYPHLLQGLSTVEEGVGVSLVATLCATGTTSLVAHSIVAACTAALLVGAWLVANRPDGTGAHSASSL
jgi:Glycosyltransferase family 87